MSCNSFRSGELLRVEDCGREAAWGWRGSLADSEGNLRENAKVLRQPIVPGRIAYALETVDFEPDDLQDHYTKVMLDSQALTVPTRFLTQVP